MDDLRKLTIILVFVKNRSKIIANVFASLLKPSQKIDIFVMSSTNRRCVMRRKLQILMRLNQPMNFSSFKNMLSPSATSKKMRGEIGHPFLGPLSDLKKGSVEPFIKTRNETNVMQLMN